MLSSAPLASHPPPTAGIPNSAVTSRHSVFQHHLPHTCSCSQARLTPTTVLLLSSLPRHTGPETGLLSRSVVQHSTVGDGIHSQFLLCPPLSNLNLVSVLPLTETAPSGQSVTSYIVMVGGTLQSPCGLSTVLQTSSFIPCWVNCSPSTQPSGHMSLSPLPSLSFLTETLFCSGIHSLHSWSYLQLQGWV